MHYLSVRVAVLGLLLFSTAAVAFSPTLVTKIYPNPSLTVVLNSYIGALPTLEFKIFSPYLAEQGLSPFQIESIVVPAVKESDGTRDALRYHILETKIAEVETILYDIVLSARQHLREDDAQAYEQMRDKNKDRLHIHRDIVDSITQSQWKLWGLREPSAEDVRTTDPYYYEGRAKFWGAFALTADNQKLLNTEIDAWLENYRENIEQQDLSESSAPYHRNGVSDNYYDLDDGWVHIAALLKNSSNDGLPHGRSESYLFDTIFTLRDHIDVHRVALLYAFKFHLLRQQVDLKYAHVSDHRPDITRAWSNSKSQEAFGISIYHLLSREFGLTAPKAEAKSESSSGEQVDDESEVEGGAA